MPRILHRVWSALRRYAPTLIVTTAVVFAFAALLVSFDAASGGITVRLFPGSSVNAAQASTPVATDTPVAPTATDTPPATSTSTPPPLPPTTTPIPVVAATITCAHAQTNPSASPGTYMGELCVHTAPHSAIAIAIMPCGVSPAQAQGIDSWTDTNGNWSLSDTQTQNNPWSFTAPPSCAIPFTVDLVVRGTTPSGETISGSASFVVSR